MFGYATERDRRADAAADLARAPLAERLAAVRKAGTLDYLRPDGKTQVSVRYQDGKPVEIEKLLISTQHAEGAEALIKRRPAGSTSSSRSCRATSTTRTSCARTSSSTRPAAS